ncbi:MAG: type II toxin-antitoxin system YoeB family toxin [Treponema sp.]|jgi:Txe/YoeB family toxin of Txe-Axe toxin-antitoxin module|nr:type II toxin-antitoxin system YoeB family toxin [Treponema sp.]
MNDLVFDPEAFKEYAAWQTEDRKTLKKINLPTLKGGRGIL